MTKNTESLTVRISFDQGKLEDAINQMIDDTLAFSIEPNTDRATAKEKPITFMPDYDFERAAGLYESGLLTLNEARATCGLPPVPGGYTVASR